MKLIKNIFSIESKFDEKEWTRVKLSFMNKDFGESMCKETKHKIIKFFEEKIKN